MTRCRVLNVFGTRPEAIKLAPVVLRLAVTADLESRVCVTGQHREMLDPVNALFGIVPDHDLNLMRQGQDLSDVTAAVLLGMRTVLRAEQPDLVLVQGDTTTCLAAALAAFYAGIPVGHVEAGLRTGDLSAPFPEEANRILVSRLARFHFAPTETARDNLIAEGVHPAQIHVTGNTVIDALQVVRTRLDGMTDTAWDGHIGREVAGRWLNDAEKRVLVTGHRRESFGEGFENICQAVHDLSVAHPTWQFVYPVHLNPNVRAPVTRLLEGVPNIALIEPLDYFPFVWLMNSADLILTDSGGIQEEGPALGKPVLVMRSVTERPEAVAAGTVLLLGTDRKAIVEGVEGVLMDPEVYGRMARAHSPYGDGRAAERIVEIIRDWRGLPVTGMRADGCEDTATRRAGSAS